MVVLVVTSVLLFLFYGYANTNRPSSGQVYIHSYKNVTSLRSCVEEIVQRI